MNIYSLKIYIVGMGVVGEKELSLLMGVVGEKELSLLRGIEAQSSLKCYCEHGGAKIFTSLGRQNS